MASISQPCGSRASVRPILRNSRQLAVEIADAPCQQVVIEGAALDGEGKGLDAIPVLMAASKAKILVLTGSRDEAVHHSAVLCPDGQVFRVG